MVKVRRYPHKPGPQEWLEETGFLGREEVLPEIYHSTRLFGPFCTRPESASLPGSSKRWRGLPTADTRVFRAHRHLSSTGPLTPQTRLSGCEWRGPSLPPFSSPPQSSPLQELSPPKCCLLFLHDPSLSPSSFSAPRGCPSGGRQLRTPPASSPEAPRSLTLGC